MNWTSEARKVIGMKHLYGQRWHTRRNRPIDPMDEAEARARFNGERPDPHDWFTVAAFPDDAGPDRAPDYYIEITPHADYAKVHFVDEHGSIHYILGFRKMGGKLFLEYLSEYSYPDMSRHYRRNECIKLETVTYKPNGIVRVETDDNNAPDISIVDIKDVDVRHHWEPVPEFGHWESLGRFTERWEGTPEPPGDAEASNS